MDWTQYFINIAEQVKLKSKDESTQIGAVIVGSNHQIISTGYNSFPRGIDDNVSERQERPEKYFWFEHAERNSIFNAALTGVSTKDCTIYLTCGLPCADCARGIISAGISKIVCVTGAGTSNEIWKEHFRVSKQMLKEANVEVVFLEYDLDGTVHICGTRDPKRTMNIK